MYYSNNCAKKRHYSLPGPLFLSPFLLSSPGRLRLHAMQAIAIIYLFWWNHLKARDFTRDWSANNRPVNIAILTSDVSSYAWLKLFPGVFFFPSRPFLVVQSCMVKGKPKASAGS